MDNVEYYEENGCRGYRMTNSKPIVRWHLGNARAWLRERPGLRSEEAEHNPAELAASASCLSKAHISTAGEVLGREIAVCGGLVRFRNLESDGNLGGRFQGGKREVVTGYSVAARRRFMRMVAQWGDGIFDSHLVLDVTLTYPAEFPTARQTKPHLDRFLHRLKRAWPGAFGFWKLEPQKRGAPHYHLINAVPLAGQDRDEVWGQFWEWFKGTWTDIAGDGDMKHYRVAAHVKSCRPVDGYRQFACYVSKYVGKAIPGAAWELPGRFWGVFNRKDMEAALSTRTFAVSSDTWNRVRRIFRKHASAKERSQRRRVRRSAVARGQGTWFTFDRGVGRDDITVLERLLCEYSVNVLEPTFEGFGGLVHLEPAECESDVTVVDAPGDGRYRRVRNRLNVVGNCLAGGLTAC